ncbi:MAG: hypothetical protein ACTSWN_15745 [Promethearchaeota archaeon]
MLENIYILTSSGVCIYHYTVQGAMEFNENLVSAFLTALNQFTQEAFMESSLEKLSISNRKKLIFYNPKNDSKIRDEGLKSKNIYLYAIIHYYDHETLAKNILRQIYKRFVESFEDLLVGNKFLEVSKFNVFDEDIKKILNHRIYPRTKRREFLGIAASLSILLGVLIPFVLLFVLHGGDKSQLESRVQDYLDAHGLLIPFLIFNAITNLVVGISCFVGGYISGTRRHAIRNGTRLGFSILIIPVMGIIRNGLGFFLVNILIFLYFGLNAVMMYYFGGFLRDRLYLYPPENLNS